jgi:hypothetical protein
MPYFTVRGPTPLGVPLDQATIDWIAAVVTAGGTVSTPRGIVVNTFILGLMTDGIWSKLDRLWLLAAENSQSALFYIV